ncbi:homogentisate 1,2-dioxygenase [Pelagibius litoralis]|uniref:Homogentisate 1,2-dioxygenase n=1 Tax=Pelagibius litoralis TaxID=374515 RepID=A0A967K9F0_9PROT|nr:homogentisate 1,2-dioxygenase [Pelagibius litoralis]NIA69284.1 homogentisate 1,2-dioxygenase [Pelagibius litoralis]
MALSYLSGFGNEFQTEALPGALPVGQNSPQRCPYGLYAEQLSGTAFTAPRADNARSWLYRIRPSVKHQGRFSRIDLPLWRSAPTPMVEGLALGPLRWGPPPMPSEALTFVTGMRTITTAGDARVQSGMAAHLYFVTQSMAQDYFYNADGELLVVPQQGSLRFATELGVLEVAPGDICVLPRGMKFRVELIDKSARGYVCENYGAAFNLPDLGPIGANGLANARDFQTPAAAFEDRAEEARLTVKWGGAFHACDIGQSPLDVVAWHGNYAPYKYDLKRFSPVNAVLFDHPDPSIFTVLTAPSDTPGTANVDFAIFPERWMVAEGTFRPPWYHMNVMSEFMGLIYGIYDAKPDGFQPGGMSLHNAMLPHGPDQAAFDQASREALQPMKQSGTLAFMFETRFPQQVTDFAAKLETLDKDYVDCWSGLEKLFDGTP